VPGTLILCRMESEADHIGLMLMAAAGYDPTLAPGIYEKMGQLGKEPEFLQYVNTHPSGKSRAEALRNSNTMQEAVRIYSDKIAGQGQHGFL
jgi:predicted Zn-dependent protease